MIDYNYEQQLHKLNNRIEHLETQLDIEQNKSKRLEKQLKEIKEIIK